MAPKKLSTFNVEASLDLKIGIQIKAESLEDAIQQSKDLKVQDFVKILGDYNDGDLKRINWIGHND